jgi:hypothetical protein
MKLAIVERLLVWLTITHADLVLPEYWLQPLAEVVCSLLSLAKALAPCDGAESRTNRVAAPTEIKRFICSSF